MPNCDNRPVYKVVNHVAWGTPQSRVFRPIIRINGLMQDAPQGWKINPCYLPEVLTFPEGVAPLDTGTYVTPTNVIGDTSRMLGAPPLWVTINIDGTDYVIPAYPPVLPAG